MQKRLENKQKHYIEHTHQHTEH